MKMIADFLGILLFFGAYLLTNDIFVATAIAIPFTILQVGFYHFRGMHIDRMQWVSLVLMIVFGGAALISHNKWFMIWKFTILDTILGLGLIIGQFMGKNGIRALLGEQVTLPDAVWGKLCHAWGIFFIALAALNLVIAFNFSEKIWINFKLFGTLGLTIAFAVAQSVVLSRYVQEE